LSVPSKQKEMITVRAPGKCGAISLEKAGLPRFARKESTLNQESGGVIIDYWGAKRYKLLASFLNVWTFLENH
jgi:hypothetical protein